MPWNKHKSKQFVIMFRLGVIWYTYDIWFTLGYNYIMRYMATVIRYWNAFNIILEAKWRWTNDEACRNLKWKRISSFPKSFAKVLLFKGFYWPLKFGKFENKIFSSSSWNVWTISKRMAAANSGAITAARWRWRRFTSGARTKKNCASSPRTELESTIFDETDHPGLSLYI